MSARVNGFIVPVMILKSQLGVYFPNGVLGLRKLLTPASPSDGAGDKFDSEEQESFPVFLNDDGSLELEPGAEYYVPSLATMARELRVPDDWVPVAQTALREGSHYLSRGDPDAEELGVVEANGFERPVEGSWPGVEASGSYKGPTPARHSHDPHSHYRHARKEEGGVLSRLVNRFLDKGSSAKWNTERRQQLRLFLYGMLFVFALSLFVLMYDHWISCDCEMQGLWNTCAKCLVLANRTSVASPNWNNHTTATFEYSKCLDAKSVDGCDSPDFVWLRKLIVAATCTAGLSALIGTIDVAFHAPPKKLGRFVYIALFILEWCLSAIICQRVAEGGSTTDVTRGNRTQIECAIHRSLQDYVDIVGVKSNTTKYLVTVHNCHFGWSFWVYIISTAWWTIVGLMYFVRRFLSWANTQSWIQSGLQALRGEDADGQ